jgi:hypothetical protein
MEHICEVRMYRASKDCPNDHGITHSCESCRIGCFKVARFRNPNFGVTSETVGENRWWMYQYNYAEWLCADHYDEVMEEKSEYEELYSEED